MRLRHEDGTVVHSAYCTNVHAGDGLDDVLAHLDRYALPVRRHLGGDVLGLGLWLAAPAARALARDGAALARLRAALDVRGLEVVTLNGFPYKGFQDPVVKHKVYQPDWTTRARLDYTVDLAHVLAALLPDDAARGSISTLPLGWRKPWYGDRQAVAVEHLARLAEALDRLEDTSGREIRVALEPEPGCVVECTQDAVDRLADVDRRRVGVCLDLCHLAVRFEEPDDALARLAGAGLPVVKAQVSAALHADAPHDPATRAALASFDEPRFLHQVSECCDEQGGLATRDDLPDALGGPRPLGPGAWRVHFHVPLVMDPQPPLRATRDRTVAALAALVGGDRARTDHLEVETYTWGVLPEHARPRTADDRARRIAGVVGWLRETLVDLGLKEMS